MVSFGGGGGPALVSEAASKPFHVVMERANMKLWVWSLSTRRTAQRGSVKPFPAGPVPFVRPVKAEEAWVLAVLTKEVFTVEKHKKFSLRCLVRGVKRSVDTLGALTGKTCTIGPGNAPSLDSALNCSCPNCLCPSSSAAISVYPCSSCSEASALL